MKCVASHFVGGYVRGYFTNNFSKVEDDVVYYNGADPVSYTHLIEWMIGVICPVECELIPTIWIIGKIASVNTIGYNKQLDIDVYKRQVLVSHHQGHIL